MKGSGVSFPYPGCGHGTNCAADGAEGEPHGASGGTGRWGGPWSGEICDGLTGDLVGLLGGRFEWGLQSQRGGSL